MPGVGLYIDAKPSVNARSLQIQTPRPGWQMEVHATRARPGDNWPSDDWTQVGGGTVARHTQTFKLRTGDKRYRYYLVWIKKLPPERASRRSASRELAARHAAEGSLTAIGGRRSRGIVREGH